MIELRNNGLGRKRIVSLVDEPTYINCELEDWVKSAYEYLNDLKTLLDTNQFIRLNGKRGITEKQKAAYEHAHNVWYVKDKEEKNIYPEAYDSLVEFLRGDSKYNRGFNDEELECIEKLADYLLFHFRAFGDKKFDIQEAVDKLMEKNAITQGEAKILPRKKYEERIKRHLEKKNTPIEQRRAILYGLRKNLKDLEEAKTLSDIVIGYDVDSYATAESAMTAKLGSK